MNHSSLAQRQSVMLTVWAALPHIHWQFHPYIFQVLTYPLGLIPSQYPPLLLAFPEEAVKSDMLSSCNTSAVIVGTENRPNLKQAHMELAEQMCWIDTGILWKLECSGMWQWVIGHVITNVS